MSSQFEVTSYQRSHIIIIRQQICQQTYVWLGVYKHIKVSDLLIQLQLRPSYTDWLCWKKLAPKEEMVAKSTSLTITLEHASIGSGASGKSVGRSILKHISLWPVFTQRNYKQFNTELYIIIDNNWWPACLYELFISFSYQFKMRYFGESLLLDCYWCDNIQCVSLSVILGVAFSKKPENTADDGLYEAYALTDKILLSYSTAFCQSLTATSII